MSEAYRRLANERLAKQAAENATEPAERFARLDEGRYRLRADDCGVVFDVDRLRRESGALIGELLVTCSLPGANTYNGILSAGDLNLSSVSARATRGKYLQERSRAADVDWTGLLEELAQRVIADERQGQPAVLLRDLPRPTADDTINIDGLPILTRHPIVLFGDGGTAKSLLGLHLAGRLEQLGKRVLFADWELAGEDHRDRLERLFGDDMPGVRYARCSAPLIHERDRLRRIIAAEQINYVICDSIGFATDAPPETAEAANHYFQSVRQLGPIGSLHVAHISKQEGSDKRPYGSVFWHNMARATWFVKRAEDDANGRVNIALYNRKANLGALQPAIGFEIAFTDLRVTFRRVSVADTPELAAGLSVRQRMAGALRNGAMEPDELAEYINAGVETIRRTARRYSRQFVVIPGGKLGLSGGHA